MSNIAKVVVFVVCAAAMSFVLGFYELFHGYFDRGQFEIKEAQWSTSKQIAMVAERSDQEGRSGDTYFVLIGDHMLSPDELRHAYHSDARVFAAASSCLDLHWESRNKLIVACNGNYLDQQNIDVEKQQSKGVFISYVNISPDTAQTFQPK